MFAKISWVCLFLTVALLVWGGLWFLTTEGIQDSGEVLIVEQTQRDLGEQSLGPHMVEVRVHNTGNRPHRILGIPHG